MFNKTSKHAVDGTVSFHQPSSSSYGTVTAVMPVEAESEYYNMNHPNRGLAVIVNNETFDVGNFNKRTGTDIDCNNLHQELNSLGFDVRVFKDYKYIDLINAVEKIAELDHSINDCFLMAILTHGGDSDILYAKDLKYNLDEIWSKFTADSCPTLAGKPKIFLVQACRGDKFDLGIALRRSRVEVDGKPMQSYRIPVYADFLIAYSTVAGHYSFRDTESGSWFIQAFCDELKTNGKILDFQRILTRVSRSIAIGYENNDTIFGMNNLKQMPSITTMLTRLILFSDKQ